jgi:tRNA threonylcarbamoyladenosine biosynthesis protein TsaE
MREQLLFLELSEDRLPEISARLIEASASRIFLINGAMGAGKTTLIKALCRKLGSKDELSSPTFSIVNEYAWPGGKIYHFDLYRLKETSELLDIGIEEYLDSGHYCFIEWPSLAEGLVESEYVAVMIDQRGGQRFLAAEKVS